MIRRAFAPLDAAFDLLEQSAGALHRQAEALTDRHVRSSRQRR